MGIRLRFSIFLVILCQLTLGIFASVVYLTFKKQLYYNSEQNLSVYLEHEWQHLANPKIQQSHSLAKHDIKDIYLRFYKNKTIVWDMFPAELPKGENMLTVKDGREIEGDHYELVGIYDFTSTQNYLSALRKLLITVCVSASLFIFPISYLVSKLLLKPFSKLSKKTSELHAEKLSFRFPPPKHRDEYSLLVKSFNELLEKLENSFEQLRLFATNASHELRTPVAAIIAQTEMALRNYSEHNLDFKYLDKILYHSKNLSALISQLLLLSDIKRNGELKQPTVIPVQQTLQQILEILRPVYKANVTLIPEQFGYSITSNQELFTSVVTNVIENALKFSNENIKISVSHPSQNLELVIEDDGPGILPERREEVFHPFVKASHIKNDKKNSGYGIGLSIVKTSLEILQGEIKLAESDLGGLKATISIPASPNLAVL